MDPIRVATWNVGWTSSRSRDFDRSRERIAELNADFLILTETTPGLIPEGGYLAKGGPDWGYETKPGRRKVVFWSRWPLTNVSSEISEPGGRHVCATAETPRGPVRVHAVCVPWSNAHVSGGSRNRKVWEDHLRYLISLRELLRRERAEPGTAGLPVIVAGDINQRDQPKPYGTHKVRQAWANALAEADLTVVTNEEMIDKIAVGPGLTASDSLMFPPETMSDHHAVSCLVVVPGQHS
ncbi:MAG: endonuclease/exonuclease/phosphatase family protein [Solirubrobacterales bacterium]